MNNYLVSVLSRTGCFTPDECARVVEMGAAIRKRSGIARGEHDGIRDSRVCFITPGPDTAWIYARLEELVMAANRQFQFHLTGFHEPLQIAEYESGGHYDWHVDIGTDVTSGRKLSASVQLSDGDSYEGGDLEFLNVKLVKPQRSIGSLTIFPSYLAHRVTPVTRGVRHSLVAWVHGDSFR